MANWLEENYKGLFAGLALIGSWLVYLGRKYDWLRQRPKEKADTDKVKQEIISSNIADALKINAGAMEQNGQLMAQLAFINAAFEKVQENEEKQRLLIIELKEKIDTFIKMIEECRKENKRLKDLYEPG